MPGQEILRVKCVGQLCCEGKYIICNSVILSKCTSLDGSLGKIINFATGWWKNCSVSLAINSCKVPHTNIFHFWVSLLAPFSSSLRTHICNYWPVTELFEISIFPMPQCYFSRCESLQHHHCTNNKQTNKSNNYNMVDPTHVPRQQRCCDI